ncbi:MAG: ankyrin repeat domain-containing protein [Cyanobacteria bacterium P01_H01_bin.58]
MFSAIYEDNFETIQILVENHKVDVNIFRSGIWSKRGWSILMDAIEAEQLHTAKLLLKYGADPNYVEGDEGQTPIMCAVASHNLEFVSCLLEARANVNTPNTNGKTPLMKAAELGNTEVVKLLIKNGANADATDYANMDAIWYAEKMGNSEIKCIIRGDV